MADDENPFNDESVSSSARDEEAGMPSWLEDVPVDTPSVPLSSQRESNYAPPGSNWSSGYVPEEEDTAAAAEEQRQPPGPDNLILYMRLCNVAATVLMSTMAVIKLLSLPGFNSAILSIYIWFFAILLCCFETHLKQVSKIIAENFGFLYHAKGRAAFFVLIGVLCLGISFLGVIAGFFALATAVFNIYVLHKHPEYEKKQQQSDREQKGPANVAEFSQDAFLASGAAWAQRNPDLAASAVAAGASYAVQSQQYAPTPSSGTARDDDPNAAYI